MEGIGGNRYLVCVDSDGCAMDTMDRKHKTCFGPLFVKEWGLEQWQEALLERWNHINLYSMSRGINRFLALGRILEEVQENCRPVEDLESLTQWLSRADRLSEAGLEETLTRQDSPCLRRALAWSRQVNEAIAAIQDEEKTPFAGVKEGLMAAKEFAALAVVSSANREAVMDEWRYWGLTEYVDEVLTQDMGSKAACIHRLLGQGYTPERVLMVGDAPGDLEAALKNGVHFFPVLVGREAESWARLRKEGLARFLDGTYGEVEQGFIREFLGNLQEDEFSRKENL